MKRYSVYFSLLMVLILGCNMFSGLGAVDSSSDPGLNPGSESQPTPPVLSQPLAPVLFSGSPEEQAANFSSALIAASDNPSRVALWLGLYESVGIPVIDEGGAILTNTGDDPVGAPYWVVWYAAGLDRPMRGMTLVDAGKILTAQPDGTFDTDSGQTLLNDLRHAAQSEDPQIRLLALFARERMLKGSTGKDVLVADVSPEMLRIDPATVQLLYYALVRSVLYEIAKTEPQTSAGGRGLARISPQFSALPMNAGKARCAELFGSEDTTAAVNWLANKLYTGLSIPGIGGLPGLAETSLKQIGVSLGNIEKINTFAARANAIGAVLSLYMQIQSLQVEGESTQGGPLVRTRSTSPGERQSLTWHLFYDKEKMPDGNQLWACMANFISNTFGVTFGLPPSEGVGGADIIFAPGYNIPEKVLFDSENTNYRITTDSSGYAVLNLIGKGQKKTIPNSAPPYDDNYSILVSAQPEGLSSNSLVSMFMDSFGFVIAPTVAGAVLPLVDLLKTMHYDMGEHQFLLTDWRIGYTASGGQGIDITGAICGSLTDPFHLEGAVPDGSNVAFSYTPSDEKSGSYSYAGSGGGISFAGSGNYTIAETDTDELMMTQTETQGCVIGEGGGCKEYTNIITLTPADSCNP